MIEWECLRFVRIRTSIAIHIHGTKANGSSHEKRPSQRIMESAKLNSRVNNNLSHRLHEPTSEYLGLGEFLSNLHAINLRFHA